MVLVYQLSASFLGNFSLAAKVYVDFGARTTRTYIAHFPKIIFFVAKEDTLFGQVLLPKLQSFSIWFEIFGGIAFKNRDIKALFGQAIYLGEQLPTPSNGLFLEIIAKRPVAEHFEERMVVSIVAYIFQIVVLACYAEAFLGIGNARRGRCFGAQEEIFELRHTGVHKHQCRVVFEYQRR